MTKAFEAFGFRGCTFEVKHARVTQNILTREGFLFALTLIWRLAPKSIIVMAPVCSTWVYMSRSRTMRSEAFPHGATDRRLVRDANVMISRLCFLIELAEARGVWWVVEQPLTSIMHLHKRFQRLLQTTVVFYHSFDMRRFGSPSRKPTKSEPNVELC